MNHHGAGSSGHIDFVKGTNIVGFFKVADTMLAQGEI